MQYFDSWYDLTLFIGVALAMVWWWRKIDEDLGGLA